MREPISQLPWAPVSFTINRGAAPLFTNPRRKTSEVTTLAYHLQYTDAFKSLAVRQSKEKIVLSCMQSRLERTCK